MRIFAFIILVLLPIEVFSSFEHLSFIDGCYIFNLRGEIVKKLPGDFCVFFDDGSYLSSTHQNLVYYSKDDVQLWELKQHVHHQLNVSSDLTKILTMSSGVLEEKGRKIRYDKFQVISRDGKILHERSSIDLLTENKKKLFDFSVPQWLREQTGADKEVSHFNSIYEVPEVSGNHPDYLKKGNIIINGIQHGVFILTPDLKRTLYSSTIPTSRDHYVHDVQVKPDGSMIYFNNISRGSNVDSKYSSVEEMDFTGKLIFEFTASPKEMFFSKACGGVQVLNSDLILFSDMFNGTFVYSRTKKDIVYSTRAPHFKNGIHHTLQQVKAQDLRAFLKNRK